MIVHENERLDELNNLKIIQNPKGFCYGTDAVILANFSKAMRGEVVVDFCTGTGAVPLLMVQKTKAEKFFGIEILPEVYDMAKRSVELNNLMDKITIINDNIINAPEIFKGKTVDVVTCNPPYMNQGGGFQNGDEAIKAARHEVFCTIEDVILSASKILRFGGRLYLIHKCERLCDIFVYMRKYNLEPKKLQYVIPKINKAPNLVLIEGMKGAKPYLHTLPPLVIYNEDNTYTKEYLEFTCERG